MDAVKIWLELDLDADAAYIRLATSSVAETREVNEEVLVDLDEHGVVVGIETLRADAAIPFVELETRFHVHSDVIAALRTVRPNPSAFVGFWAESDTQSGSRLTSAETVEA